MGVYDDSEKGEIGPLCEALYTLWSPLSQKGRKDCSTGGGDSPITIKNDIQGCDRGSGVGEFAFIDGDFLLFSTYSVLPKWILIFVLSLDDEEDISYIFPRNNPTSFCPPIHDDDMISSLR